MLRKNIWETFSDGQLADLEKLCVSYRRFLDSGKTERECVDYMINEVESKGYVNIREHKGEVKPGDRLYDVNMSKMLVLYHIGSEPLENGMNILGAHIDSPRLDIKQNPLYEDGDFAYLDTHYYGGVKKYQWVTIPLALHGVVVKKDGTVTELSVGEDEDDPVFFVSDILIHLSREQLEKKGSDVIEGEALDIIVGNRPKLVIDGDNKEADGKDPVREAIINILKTEYDMEEEDFLSAELEVVPAGKAREAGFDRSMILAYGQDDRVCAYTSLRALLDCEDIPGRTACCIFVDKEEIGSVGATGMRSLFFENSVSELLEKNGLSGLGTLRRCLASSCMLSSDVSAGFDPSYASPFEKKNSAYLGRGIVFNKYTGTRGKSGSNDANAEYMAYLRRIFAEDSVHFQTAELGRVDFGGGGTIAYITALYGMNVIDSGVAVLNMHAPMEATSKADIYEAYRGYKSFLSHKGDI